MKDRHNKKVIVGLSGGVDSAVTAYLLKESGYDVTGIMLRTQKSDKEKDIPSPAEEDARRIAEVLNIPFFVKDAVNEFETTVIKPFMDEYIAGRTPNPCIECNRHVKFEKMLQIADETGSDYIATGHYAFKVLTQDNRYTLKKAAHLKKDQTYMLWKLKQEQLERTLMPLGGYTKEMVREIAEKASLPVSRKKDSQEICFIPDNDHAAFIMRHYDNTVPQEGFFVDEEGDVLGTHKGIINYTVGQRKKLGLSLGYPAFVKHIDAGSNQVVIGPEESVYGRRIVCTDVNYLGLFPLEIGETVRSNVKIRYQHKAQSASVRLIEPDKLLIIFDEPVRAAAPGQSAVMYDENDCVQAGGIISEAE